jgi:hypothetical protein
MVKQPDIFTGKIDIIADANDTNEQLRTALQSLGDKAGRVLFSKGQRPAPQVEKNVRQTNLFV